MMQATLLLLLGLATAAYLYFKHIYKYWIKKGISQETPTFMVGNLLDAILNKKNVGWIYNELYFKYQTNDAVGLYDFEAPKLLLRNPELIETVLIKDFKSFYDNEIYANVEIEPFLTHNAFLMRGERWKPARNSMINGLTKNKLKDMYEIMKQTIPRLKSFVDDNLDKDIQAMELAHLFMMTNVSSTVYGIDSNCFTDPNAAYRKMILLFSKESWQSWWQVLIIFYMQPLRDFLGFGILPKAVTKFVRSMVGQVVEARLKDNKIRKDYLNYYLHLNKPLEDKLFEITSNGVTFFIGGFETSALPSGNLIYELALNQTIQENLYQELAEAYGEKDELDYDTLMTLPLLDKAFKESLRKYPILYSANKVCTKPTTLNIDGKAVKIDKGVRVVVPTYAVHHDPRHYPEPEVFDPERFSEESLQARHPCTWLPFGLGPRICAGMKFGILQAKLLVASVVLNYKVECTEKTPLKISLKKSAFLVVTNEAQWIRLVKRK